MGILRVLLALSVLASHVGPICGLHLVPGQIPVQSFCIISGFYMSLILNEKYIGNNSSFKLFITNRLLRLYPLYTAVLFITFITNFLIAVSSNYQTFPVIENYISANTSISSYLFLILTNIVIVGQDVVMFLGINANTGNLFFTTDFWSTSPMLWTFLVVPQAWTLASEITFYLVAPIILRRSLKIVLLIIFISLSIRFFIYYYLSLKGDPWTYRFFPTEIFFFLLGYLSYRIYVLLKTYPVSITFKRLTLAVVVIYTVMYSFIPSSSSLILQFYWRDIFYFLLLVFTIPILFTYFKDSKMDTKIADLSYSIYLLHILISRICYLLPYSILKSPLCVAFVTILFSLLLNVCVSVPIEKYRQKRLRKRIQQTNDSDVIPKEYIFNQSLDVK